MGSSWVMLLLIAAALSSSTARKEVVAEQISTLDHGTGESIRVAEVSVGTLASSYDIVGLWPHGGHYEDDALFFNEEDAVYDQWITKKREQRQNQQRKEKQRDKTGAGGATGSASSGSFKKATFSDLTYSAVKSRAVERRRVIKGVRSSNSSSYDAAWGVLLQDAERLRGLLSTASLMEPGRDKESSPEAQYVRLLSSAFRHTTRNLTMETGDSLMATWFSALPFPVILNGDTLLASEQEVRAITTDLQAMRTMTRPRKAENASEKEAAGVIDVEGTALMVEAALKSAATIVAASRNAHRIVSKLVMPVIAHAKDTIQDQLRHVEQEIRSNDESTVAKRRELKEMTKFKKMIKSTRDMIFTADNELRNVFYSTSPTLSKTAFVTSLAVICRLRLAEITYIGAFDTIPSMEPLADLTGVLKKELQALVLYPLAMGVSISAAVLWVLLSVRQFIIKKMRQRGGRSARSTAGDAGRRVGASWFLTVALRANLLLEAIVPVFLPIIVAHIVIEQQALKELVHPVLVISKPGQRLALGIIVLGALVLSFVLSRLLVAVDSWSSSSGRKPNEKKLH